MGMKAVLEKSQGLDSPLPQRQDSYRRALEHCLVQKVQIHTNWTHIHREVLKETTQEHHGHFTKSPFHLALSLNKECESEMSNKAQEKTLSEWQKAKRDKREKKD